MSFQNYRLPNNCLCKCLKSHVSIRPRKVNMLKNPKRALISTIVVLSVLFIISEKF